MQYEFCTEITAGDGGVQKIIVFALQSRQQLLLLLCMFNRFKELVETHQSAASTPVQHV